MAADNNQGMDLMQLAQQVMGNPDLLSALTTMDPSDTSGIASALQGAGISISEDQVSELAGMASGLLGSVDLGQLAQSVNLNDMQGMLGGFLGGK